MYLCRRFHSKFCYSMLVVFLMQEATAINLEIAKENEDNREEDLQVVLLANLQKQQMQETEYLLNGLPGKVSMDVGKELPARSICTVQRHSQELKIIIIRLTSIFENSFIYYYYYVYRTLRLSAPLQKFSGKQNLMAGSTI